MKRRLSIVIVAAVAVGSLGSYVAHANPLSDDIRIPRSLALNLSAEIRGHRGDLNQLSRTVLRDLKSHPAAYKKNQADYFQVLNNSAFNVFNYVCGQASITHGAKTRMANAFQSEMFQAAQSNLTLTGANTNAAGGVLWKASNALHSTVGRSDRKIDRGMQGNVKLVNRGEKMEAVWTWAGSGSCAVPTPSASSGTYFHVPYNPGFVFTVMIPSPGSGFSNVYTCGYAPPGSVLIDILGSTAGGSASGSADFTTGCFLASGSAFGSGNVMCEMVSNSVTCGRMGSSLGCGPVFSESVGLDR